MGAWPAWVGDICPLCGDFLPGERSLRPPLPCKACADSPPPFGARSLFPYEGAAGEAVRAIKYKGHIAPAAALAERLTADGIRRRWGVLFPDGFNPLIVPVPIRPFKYLRRGFNLPSLVAGALARRTGWHCDLSLLERISETAPQAGLHQPERRRNVESAFRVAGRGRGAVPPAILLLDDVYTTGATARACALALKRGGARHIVVVTIARTTLTQRHAPETR
ncbi:MAG TPA: hypothetical protein VIU29_05945 [Candidatus Deferrimicrobiaceae bacterium]